ncbi:MAG: ParA family protein [Gammaproteobacteria bacterium]|nr:ParA family protein [Gammaproteobacteria bacterium]
MQYVIGVVAQKGGTGKSTLARLAARAQLGLDVLIADLDTQQTTCTDWAADRAKAGIEPRIDAEPFPYVRRALKKGRDRDAIVLDGRPHASDQTTEIARAAHEIVIPTGQTLDDLRPAVALAHDLADAGIKPRLISCAALKTTRSVAELTVTRTYLAEAGYTVLDGDIPLSTAYGIAHDAGRALSATPYPTLNQRAELLARPIVDRARAAVAHERAAAAR